jgi:hypothetical protein
MIVIKMRDGSKEAFAPVLLFKRAFRNVNVRLFRDFAFGEIHGRRSLRFRWIEWFAGVRRFNHAVPSRCGAPRKARRL